MKILPVLDLMDGQVVRGIAGRRREYAPIVSRWTASTRPRDVARALRDRFGFGELYLADLDAIAGKPPAPALFAELLGDGWKLWVDAGPAWTTLAELGVSSIIAGLESLQGPEQLHELIDRYSSDRVVFSLDLHNGQPLTGIPRVRSTSPWGLGVDALSIARQAVDGGVQRMLVLDLAAVGMNQGTPTGESCSRLRSLYPSLEITTGGGVRGQDDLLRLRQRGVDNVLIASALHDGCLAQADVESWGTFSTCQARPR